MTTSTISNLFPKSVYDEAAEFVAGLFVAHDYIEYEKAIEATKEEERLFLSSGFVIDDGIAHKMHLLNGGDFAPTSDQIWKAEEPWERRNAALHAVGSASIFTQSRVKKPCPYCGGGKFRDPYGRGGECAGGGARQ